MYENARQRFTKAIQCLVEEPANIKERLLIAFVSQLSAIDPLDDLPEDLTVPFDRTRRLLTQDQGAGDQGTPANQIVKMTDQEASEIAAEYFAMFLHLNGVKMNGGP